MKNANINILRNSELGEFVVSIKGPFRPQEFGLPGTWMISADTGGGMLGGFLVGLLFLLEPAFNLAPWAEDNLSDADALMRQIFSRVEKNRGFVAKKKKLFRKILSDALGEIIKSHYGDLDSVHTASILGWAGDELEKDSPLLPVLKAAFRGRKGKK